MTVSNVDLLKAQFAVSKAMGERSLQSDAILVPDGFEALAILLKSFPWPVLSTAGEVEIWLPNGQKTWQPQQLETALQGAFIITETTFGHAADFLAKIAGKRFDASVFEGTPEAFTRGARIVDCFVKVEPAERDHESRTAVTQYSGTLFYNFFGETIAGNIRANA